MGLTLGITVGILPEEWALAPLLGLHESLERDLDANSSERWTRRFMNIALSAFMSPFVCICWSGEGQFPMTVESDPLFNYNIKRT